MDKQMKRKLLEAFCVALGYALLFWLFCSN